MGIVHKVIKHTNLELQDSFVMDLRESDHKTGKDPMLIAEHEDNCEADMLPKLATEDNQFTAEHIVQLCRFLAEKSKNKKTSHKRSTNSSTVSKNQMKTHCDLHMANEIDLPQRKSSKQHQHLTALLAQTTTDRQVLCNKTTFNSNTVDDRLRNLNFLAKSKSEGKQRKCDILLKIRNQIFERKRQRQKVKRELHVWRPW